ncbi:MAG: class I SAM-dependent methyltransferase [Burkholderiaceae bacterium]|nr:class I SAM-dependent methyltransferase [Roseateles sp.]MBV8470173.1 class I SAM-dependent methyltransferase [Burkholderiaceae bacterium]
MSRDSQIVEFASWFQTPPGRYLLEWEQARLDETVADLFGFHALQLGLPELRGLQTNRMPHRWLALETGEGLEAPLQAVALRCQFDALPFESGSLDLVVLPHVLELADDPHFTLREVERVLRPEGRVVILGLNPVSLWGLRQNLGHLRRQMFSRRRSDLFLPRAGEFLGYWRLRDWLRLLSFDIEQARFGCYEPPLRSEAWLARWRWMEGVGERWWPVLGAVYFMVAVKRVHGMRLVGLARQKRAAAKGAPAVAMHQHRCPHRD